MKNKSQARLTLLGRNGCHLCDDMRQALAPWVAQQAIDLHVVDVDSDPDLERRYGGEIPVLLAGEHELCRHRFDAARVTAFLTLHAQAAATAG